MDKLFKLTPIVCTALIGGVGCKWNLGSEYSSETKTMYVDYYKQPCTDNDQQLCFRGRFDTSDSFKVIDEPFTGFSDFEWGKQYKIQVEADRDDDGDDSSYALQSIDSSTEVTSNTFNLTLKNTGDILSSVDNQTWSLGNEKDFSCTGEQCDQLISSEQTSSTIELSLNANADVLTLNSVLCQAADDSFSSDCGGESDTSWDIAHYLTECGATVPSLCLLYKEKDEDEEEYQVLPFDIADFTHQWGIRYKDMDVSIVEKAGTLQSATLKSDAEQTEQVTESFLFVVRTGVAGLESSSDGKFIYDNLEFDCSTHGQCGNIDDAVAESDDDDIQIVLLEAEVSSPGENAEVRIVEVRCNDKPADFAAECIDSSDDVFWSLN